MRFDKVIVAYMNCLPDNVLLFFLEGILCRLSQFQMVLVRVNRWVETGPSLIVSISLVDLHEIHTIFYVWLHGPKGACLQGTGLFGVWLMQWFGFFAALRWEHVDGCIPSWVNFELIIWVFNRNLLWGKIVINRCQLKSRLNFQGVFWWVFSCCSEVWTELISNLKWLVYYLRKFAFVVLATDQIVLDGLLSLVILLNWAPKSVYSLARIFSEVRVPVPRVAVLQIFVGTRARTIWVDSAELGQDQVYDDWIFLIGCGRFFSAILVSIVWALARCISSLCV